MGTYQQFQAANAMREAAKAPGGMAGMGMGMELVLGSADGERDERACTACSGASPGASSSRATCSSSGVGRKPTRRAFEEAEGLA